MLYYEEGISLFVVDCDLTQDSFFKLREREKGTIGEDPALTTYMQAYFHKLQRRSYRIIKARPQEALAQAEALVAKHPEEGYQLVVFDFPGHVGTRELLELSLEMDYILSPLEPDIQSLVACLSYAKSIQDLGVSMQTARIKDIWLLWNKVDRRVRNTYHALHAAYPGGGAYACPLPDL
jgi:conjugative transposon protein traA